jgi:outer membrane protein OmpA-like peptidoglycan-associated protein
MRILTGVLSAGLIVGMASAAQADTDGWYTGAEAGLAATPTIKFKDGSKTWKENQDLGYAALGQVGYGFGPVRVEAELGWRSNGVDKVKQPFNNAPGKGSLDASSAMANVYYDVATATRITPFIGAGAGAVDVNAERLRSSGTTFSNDDRVVFGYQGIAGLSYAIDDNLSLKTDYRYLRTLNAKLHEDSSYGTGSSKAEYASHAVLVGFTYKFGNTAKPAPYAPTPVAAPAPAPAPRAVQAAPIAKNYLVFFDFDRSDITPEAGRIIGQAANVAKTGGSSSIALTGYTDSTGSEKYNMALSLRRANSVKAVLVRLGVSADEISVVGKGKTDQLVPTKDGVREPQNRRVLIVLP